MKKQIINKWVSMGLSRKSLRYQKVLSIRGGRVELLNMKHGVITYISLGV